VVKKLTYSARKWSGLVVINVATDMILSSAFDGEKINARSAGEISYLLNVLTTGSLGGKFELWLLNRQNGNRICNV
jgi:hypothetical protein